MLTLDARLSIPPNVISSKVAQTSVLLNTRTKKYYALDEVGMRFWELLKGGSRLAEIYESILREYAVAPEELKKDLLELIEHLLETGLVELAQE